MLVDSERLAVKVEAATLSELGWPLTEAEVAERFMGRSDDYMHEAIRARLGASLPAGWEELLASRYRAAFEDELAPVPGVVEALGRITLPACVASGSSPDRLRYVLERTGLYARFDGHIFSSSEVAHGKPAPDLFLHAAARMGARPGRCAVVEDSVYGLEAARAAGMPSFAFAGGALTPPARLEGLGTVLFRDMRELPALLVR